METYGNYHRLLANFDALREDRSNPFKCTHVAFASLPTRRRSTIAAIADAPNPPAALAFVETIPDARVLGRLTRGKLGEIFDEITISYDLKQALADGMLATSSIIDRSAIIESFRHGREFPEYRGDGIREAVVRDFAEAIGGLEDADSALMIVPDIQNVELIVDAFRSELRGRGLRGVRGKALFALTSRIKPVERYTAINTPGAVIVTTPVMADQLDLRQFAIAGTLAPLPPRLVSLLRNPPSRPNSKPFAVFDYAGSIAVDHQNQRQT